MNYTINGINFLGDDDPDSVGSVIPEGIGVLEDINTQNDTPICEPHSDDFYEGHINIKQLIQDIKSNQNLNDFKYDYTNYGIADNWQFVSTSTPYGPSGTFQDTANSIPYYYTDPFGQKIRTLLQVDLNKRKCNLDLTKDGYVFKIDAKEETFAFEIRYLYSDAIDKRNFSITPGIDNDFTIGKKYHGVIIKASRISDFLAVCKAIGSYKFALRRIKEVYVEALKNAKNATELKYLYENIPTEVSQYIKEKKAISVAIVLDHLDKLVEYDDTGLFSGWRDSSSSIINLLQVIGDSKVLFEKFKADPKFVKRIYYNLDGNVIYNQQSVRSRTVFASIIHALCFFNKNEGLNTVNFTFSVGEHNRVLSNQLIGNDTYDDKYDLTQEKRYVKTVTENLGGYGDGSVSRQYFTYEKPTDWEEDGETQYVHPLDLVYFIDKNSEDLTPMLLPAIVVKSMSDEAEWKEINLRIRIGVDILAIVVGIATLGAASPLLVAMAAVDVTLATADILVAISEDALMKTKDGQDFIKSWNRIMLVGGVLTAGPLLIRGAFKTGGKLIAKATNPDTINFLRTSLQNLLKRVKNLPDFKALSMEIITNLRLEFNNSILITRLENLRQLGVLIIKGEVKVKGIFKKEYVLIYEGEVIGRGNLKELIRSVDSIIKNGGKNVEDYLKALVKEINYQSVKTLLGEEFIKALTWLKGLSKQKIIDYFMKYHNVYGLRFFNEINLLLLKYSKLTRTEALILWGYTTNLFYFQLNNSLRLGTGLRKTRAIAKLLTSALKKMPVYNGPAYRAIKLEGKALAKFLSDHQVGKKVTYKDFVSCGSTKQAAFFNKPGKNIFIKFNTVKNAPIISDFADGIRFRGYKPHELLLHQNGKFKVVSFDKVKRGYLIELKQIN